MMQLSAQDILHFQNGKNDTVKVIEINTYEVVYKKFKLQYGPIYKISLIDISKIVYYNGQIEDFTNFIKAHSNPAQPLYQIVE
ncbi:MAG: hypothetical protein NW207_05465 [Cytophagales bacterium]|nr:hypothetical protein [Cytophagales bacterium]